MPLLLWYTGSHYEGLVPDTEADVLRCVELMGQYLGGTYSTTVSDIKELREQQRKTKLLDNKCRGCGVVMKRLLRHLKGKKGQACMEKYSKDEFDDHKSETAKKAKETYKKVEKNKERKKQLDHSWVKTHKERKKQLNQGWEKTHKKERKQMKQDWEKDHKEKRKQMNQDRKKRKDLSMWEAVQVSLEETLWGPIYPCICCHRNLNNRSVVKAKLTELQKFKSFHESVDMAALPRLLMDGFHWICRTCNSCIRKNKPPAMASLNALQVPDRPTCLKEMTDQENFIIAPKIDFMSVVHMPNSSMVGLKWKVTHVPIPSHMIQRTVESLPRTLDEAQIIPVSFRKQKANQKSYWQHYINPTRVWDSLHHLKYEAKNPFYIDVNIDARKLDVCEETMETGDHQEVNDEITEEKEDSSKIIDELEKEEEEYIKTDAVRKHQTETSAATFLLPENIERTVKTKLRGNKKQPRLILAPGENQVPQNILKEKHPFVQMYPYLFPDGKGGLHDEMRKKKLTLQQWIMQRLLNHSPIFSTSKPFLFSTVNFLEQHQLMSKINISFMRGKMDRSSEGTDFLQTEDGFMVFDNIPGSPRYTNILTSQNHVLSFYPQVLAEAEV